MKSPCEQVPTPIKSHVSSVSPGIMPSLLVQRSLERQLWTRYMEYPSHRTWRDAYNCFYASWRDSGPRFAFARACDSSILVVLPFLTYRELCRSVWPCSLYRELFRVVLWVSCGWRITADV